MNLRTLAAGASLAAVAACSPLAPTSAALPIIGSPAPSYSCPTITPRVNGSAHTGDVLLDCNGAQVSIQTYLYVQDPGNNYADIGGARRFDGNAPQNPASVTPVSYACRAHNPGPSSTVWTHTELYFTAPNSPANPIVRESAHVSGGQCW